MGKLNFRKKPKAIEEPLQDHDTQLNEQALRSRIRAQAEASRKRSRSQPKPKKNQTIIRAEDLQKLIDKNGGEIDENTLISMYVPRRNIKKFAAEVLRLDKLHMLVYGLIALIILLFVMAFMQEQMGNFTINLNRLELFRKGVAISDTGDFKQPTARLKAKAVEDAMNISMDELPANIDSKEGSHNGRDYLAYTYYVRNAGKEDLSYNAIVTLGKCAKGAEKAARVAVWKNDKRTVYAAPKKDGTAEPGCVNFKSKRTVCKIPEKDFKLGNVDKYTIAIWLEGDDPDCVDKIVGGTVEFSMKIDAINDDDSWLIVKYVRDIIDTLTGNDEIRAAGNDAPDYYKDRNITWDTRRNQ